MDNEDRRIERVEELERVLREIERRSRYYEVTDRADYCSWCVTKSPDHHQDCVFTVLDTRYMK